MKKPGRTHMNVRISKEAMKAAKVASARAETQLRLWVERLILDATDDRRVQIKPERTVEPQDFS